MIVTLLLTIIYYFIYGITAIFRLTPEVALPGDITSAITTASGYISSLADFLPIGTLITILGLFLAYEFAYFSMKLINWVIRKIPGIS